MEERNSRYELQPSRNGLTVPVINGVYLHSIYNPTKEAEALAHGHEAAIKNKNRILILGLGFGYHVEQIAKLANAHHSSYEIIILEPNKRLVSDFIETRNFVDKNINIICQNKVKDLFHNWSFIQFLMSKPAIIKHEASFILEKEFYNHFLSFKASKEILNMKPLLKEHSKNIFGSRDARDFDSFINNIQESGQIIDNNEYLLLALNQIKNSDYLGK